MQLTLAGETVLGVAERKASFAIELLRRFELSAGYYFADSGGKASGLTRWILQQAGVRYDAHHNATTQDPPEVIRFIRREHPETAVERPRRSFSQLVLTNALPLRGQRWCCRELKEHGGIGRFVVTGQRAEESGARAKRQYVCPPEQNGSDKTFVSPLRDFSTAEVWSLIRAHDIPYCELYDRGWTRIGCILCPNSSRKQTERNMRAYPAMAEQVRRAVWRRWEAKPGTAWHHHWNSPEELWAWWISRDQPYPDRLDDEAEDEQPALFV